MHSTCWHSEKFPIKLCQTMRLCGAKVPRHHHITHRPGGSEANWRRPKSSFSTGNNINKVPLRQGGCGQQDHPAAVVAATHTPGGRILRGMSKRHWEGTPRAQDPLGHQTRLRDACCNKIGATQIRSTAQEGGLPTNYSSSSSSCSFAFCLSLALLVLVFPLAVRLARPAPQLLIAQADLAQKIGPILLLLRYEATKLRHSRTSRPRDCPITKPKIRKHTNIQTTCDKNYGHNTRKYLYFVHFANLVVPYFSYSLTI
jgi:hypothetical protein